MPTPLREPTPSTAPQQRRRISGLTRHICLAAVMALAACSPEPAPQPVAAPASNPEPATPAPAPAPTTEPLHDVIIIGAGMAGLTAARDLQRARHSFIVLEATGRKGGRAIATDPQDFGLAIDLGGAWIHGVKTNPLTPIIDGMGFKRIATHVEPQHYFFTNHHFATPAEQRKFERSLEHFEAGLKAHVEDTREAPQPAASATIAASAVAADTASTYLPLPSDKFRKLVALNMGPLESSEELIKTSAVDAAEFISEDDAFIDRGFGGFIAEYGKDIPVELNQKVVKIAYRDGGVVVTTAKGATYRGRRALVTVSTGVLRARHIEFDPPLPPAKLAAIDRLKMGVLDKVIIGFKSDVFPHPLDPEGKPHDLENTWVLYDGDGETDDMSFVIKPGGKNVAVGFFGGDRARELEQQGKDAMVAVATRALNDICDKKIDGEITRTAVTMWNATEWTLGSYSAADPGAWHMHEVLGEPVDDLLFFAGEACGGSAYNGSFAAAYSSALQASLALSTSLRRATAPTP